MKASQAALATYRERSLHAALKLLYAGPGDQVEAIVDGFVVDVLRDDDIVEIQTAGFASIRHKLRRLVRGHRVLLVYPIPVEKWIVRVDADGCLVGRRRSPKRGGFVDVFDELVSFPDLVTDPNFSLELLAVREDEVRGPEKASGARRRWRRGWERVDRRLIEVLDSCPIASPDDLLSLLPSTLPQPFTASDLAAAIERPIRLAQRMAYCLRKAGCVDVVGHRGRTLAYSRARREPGDELAQSGESSMTARSLSPRVDVCRAPD